MTNIIKIWGCPGGGKTTSLAKHIKEAVRSVGEDRVIVTSFSKAAAQELVGRDLPINKNHVGTLHSMCYRAAGSPELAEPHVEEFNREFPAYRLPVQKESAIDTPEGVMESGEQSDFLQHYNLLRARGVETCNALLEPDRRGAVDGVFSEQFKRFISDWEGWKQANNLFDFTDLLVIAQEDFDEHPDKPSVMFVDEMQDTNSLMMELIRKWSSRTDYTIVCGDPDQAIYGFMGAKATEMLDLPHKEERILTKSYRLPVEVSKWSQRWIKQVKNRKEKEFTATNLEGSVTNLYQTAPSATYRTPEKILPSILKDISEGLTVMVLASCSYMLTPLISLMRMEGMPYSNRYRPSNGSWNPLPQGSEKRVPSWTRLMAFLDPIIGTHGVHKWTLNDWNCWKKDISPKANGLVSGILKKGFSFHGLETMETSTFFEGENETPPFYGSVEDALSWFMEAVPPSKRTSYQYPVTCASKGNAAHLVTPMVTVGTIHSVKGGEADSVYLFPDLSATGARGYYNDLAQRDSVTRLMYVGATRARRKLSLVGPLNAQFAVRWTQ
jgi:DNA helicase-2/ATP-dependent DNA helicase PcrA